MHNDIAKLNISVEGSVEVNAQATLNTAQESKLEKTGKHEKKDTKKYTADGSKQTVEKVSQLLKIVSVQKA